MKIIKNDLENFKTKLLRLNKQNSLVTSLAEKIAKKALEILTTKYAGFDAVINVEISEGIVRLSVQGKQVAFDEFGTGTLGEGSSYEGNLPTQLIEFESPKGIPQKTQGWQYNYRNKQYGTKALQGRVAQKRMFYTEQELIDFISNDLKSEIKG